MIEPIFLPQTIYEGDDFDLKLNWRVRCGATFSLSTYNARMRLWPARTDRSIAIYTLTNPQVSGEGITLGDSSPNIWAHILAANAVFTVIPHWFVLELQTPTGPILATDENWFRLAEGTIKYIV